MNLKKIIKEEMDGFDWVKPVQAFYWDSETNPLKVGDCIIDKLDFSHTNWVIEKLGQTMSGTKTITVSNGEETKILNRELFEKDLTTGRYSFCADFVTEDFDWVDDIPHEKSIGEIKKLYNGFRELFEVGDTLVVTGSIPCESMRNEGCVINLSNHEFSVGGVYRTRIKIIAIDDEMISQFVDEWGEDEVWLGVESSDDDITLHKKNDINEDFDWAEDWVEDTPTVGDKYYLDYGMDYSPVLVRVIGVIRDDIIRFKVLDEDFVQHHTEMFYDEDYGWDPTDSMSLEGFMGQSTRV